MMEKVVAAIASRGVIRGAATDQSRRDFGRVAWVGRGFCRPSVRDPRRDLSRLPYAA
jgi:hypothetical protein